MRGTLAIVVLGICGTSFAGGRDFIAEHAGAGANAENAQPYIDQFLRITESMAGWPANSAKGEWVDDMKGAEKAIAERKPGFAILDPEVFFELRKKEALEPIGVVSGQTFNKGHYSLVVKDAALKSIAADYAQGRGDLAVALDAQHRVHDLELKLLQLELDEQTALAAIERLIGGEL